MASARPTNYTNGAMLALVLLRTGIGWHFLYEGLTKLLDPHWTSAGYLQNAGWLFSGAFRAIAANETALPIVDLMNIWGQIFIGLGLMAGFLTRTAACSGALMLLIYYAANPPFLAGLSGMRVEGSYLFLDKNMVEALALLALACAPTGRYLGLDGLFFNPKARAVDSPAPIPAASNEPVLPRRALVRHLALLPGAGAFAFAFDRKHGWESFESANLRRWQQGQPVDAVSGATAKSFHFAKLSDLQGTVPHARAGSLELSRMFLGGNLVGGWAHARDLIYVDELVKAYHTDEKVFQTFQLAERCGINTFLGNPRQRRVLNDYWHKEGGKIQFISDCAEEGALEGAKRSIDAGAHACYVQGGIADTLVEVGDLDGIAKALEFIRSNGIPAGIGAHKLDTVKACVDRGLHPDFWVKTIHHINYWSAKPQPEQDNIWCRNPDETIAYMEQLPEPWIGFKTLAAGAIHPKEGFLYALRAGADFLCVGMYDFQIVDNVNIFLGALEHLGERKRPWRAV